MIWGKSKAKVITDEQKIDELLARSVDTIYPGKEQLKKELLSGRQLRVYIGIDPTATYVHIGNATNYVVLRRFHELGHKIIVLIGDFTAMIGDPSDKDALRVRLTKEQVQENLETFKDQIGKLLDFDDKENPIEFKFNSEWLAKLTFEDAVDMASNFTVQGMLERDAFEKRIKEQKPLFVHEFFYPLMQGYDSVAMDVDIELGGTDQTFNMLAGRTLMKKMKDKEKYVITTTLLENPKTGEKLMSKSKGTGVSLAVSPEEMFGQVMALPDEGIPQCFLDCTEVPFDEARKVKEELSKTKNPRDVKIRLAWEVVKMYHGASSADSAQENFRKTFSEGGVSSEVEEVRAQKSESIADELLKEGKIESKSAFRRLVEQGAVTDTGSGAKIKDFNEKVAQTRTLKIGKRKFVKLIVD